jgi:hypothetical protein
MKKTTKRSITLAALACLMLFSSACGGSSTPAASDGRVILPTIRIVQVVTQIVITPTPLPATPAPTNTAAPAPKVGWDPLSVPIYYPLIGCVASRLHKQTWAFVAYGMSVSFYSDKDIRYGPELRKLAPGESVYIVGGPWCYYNSLVWKAVDTDLKEGFVVEGDGNVYSILPLGPSKPSPTP